MIFSYNVLAGKSWRKRDVRLPEILVYIQGVPCNIGLNASKHEKLLIHTLHM